MKKTKRMASPLKCPACGREDLGITPRGFIKEHMNPGGLKCSFVAHEKQIKLIEESRKS